MGINRDKPDRWKKDIARSVDFYNEWFLNFAPQTFKTTRLTATASVEEAFNFSCSLGGLTAELLFEYPRLLPVLRMATCPPLARDRLAGLAGVPTSFISSMENKTNPKIPSRIGKDDVVLHLEKIIFVLKKLLDTDICPWIPDGRKPRQNERYRAATIIADRLSGTLADPAIRNEQERRQFHAVSKYLASQGYSELTENRDFAQMPAKTYAYHVNVPVNINEQRGVKVNIPVDIVIQPPNRKKQPVLIEAKSAGDFANVNKRRKEEAVKMRQLRETYGGKLSYVLLLCGYFDTGYLGYEAAEGIDWIWEHRLEEIKKLGI